MQELESKVQVAHQQARLQNIKKRSVQKFVIVGKYRIGKKIGSGGYGTVHEAFHLETGEKFAVKVIYFNESNYEAVKNEVKISKQLLHENIVRVEEIFESENKIYLILEFCENGELFEFVKSKGPMNEDLAAKIFMQVYSAVKYLHFKKIAHRDIKTENVLLDANMNAKLIDFGFSKQYFSEDQMMETFCGSPSYVSPEIIKKQKYYGEKVDVWSLGITLYIMLEAAEPFYADNTSDIKLRIANFQWSAPRHSSSEAIKLYEMIFVPAICRIGLSEMQNSAYFEKYFKYIKSKPKIDCNRTEKTDRMSTGETSLILLPGISANKNKIKKEDSRTASEEKKSSDMNKKNLDASLKLNFRNTRNRFDVKTKSEETKTQRNDFRVKISPLKLQKKQTELNIGFFKRDVISSLNEY